MGCRELMGEGMGACDCRIEGFLDAGGRTQTPYVLMASREIRIPNQIGKTDNNKGPGIAGETPVTDGTGHNLVGASVIIIATAVAHRRKVVDGSRRVAQRLAARDKRFGKIVEQKRNKCIAAKWYSVIVPGIIDRI